MDVADNPCPKGTGGNQSSFVSSIWICFVLTWITRVTIYEKITSNSSIKENGYRSFFGVNICKIATEQAGRNTRDQGIRLPRHMDRVQERRGKEHNSWSYC